MAHRNKIRPRVQSSITEVLKVGVNGPEPVRGALVTGLLNGLSNSLFSTYLQNVSFI